MKLSDITKDAVFGTIATITGPESVEKAYSFIQHNLPVLKLFDTIILSVNWMDGVSEDVVDEYLNMWYMTTLNVKVIKHEENQGRVFGTMELEESILKWMKFSYPEKKWLFKSSEDVLLSISLFEKEYKECQFYYLPGFSLESTQKHKDNLYEVVSTTPQTNFYVLNISNVDNLYGIDISIKKSIYLDIKKNNPTIQPWEINYPGGLKFDMESHLGRTVKNISKEMLINLEEWERLLNFVKTEKISDPSHKQVMFERIGVCHYHFWKEGIHLI